MGISLDLVVAQKMIYRSVGVVDNVLRRLEGSEYIYIAWMCFLRCTMTIPMTRVFR
jgi:hypothetical protein